MPTTTAEPTRQPERATVTVATKVRPSEHALIVAAAERLGLSKSELVRSAAVGFAKGVARGKTVGLSGIRKPYKLRGR